MLADDKIPLGLFAVIYVVYTVFAIKLEIVQGFVWEADVVIEEVPYVNVREEAPSAPAHVSEIELMLLTPVESSIGAPA